MNLDYETIKHIIDQLDEETLYLLKEAIYEKEIEEKDNEEAKTYTFPSLWDSY